MTHNPDDPNLRAFQALMQEVFGAAPPASPYAQLRIWLAQLADQLEEMQVLVADIRDALDALDASTNLP